MLRVVDWFERVPLSPGELRLHPDLGTLAGRLAESTVGALLSTIHGLDVAHLPESRDQGEVDFIINVGVHRIPIEVKYRATIDPVRDVAALQTFMSKSVNNAPFALLVTQLDDVPALGPDVLPISLSSLMLLR